MVLNGATPKIEVDAQTYEVRADGVLLTCEPATRAADGAALLPVLSRARRRLGIAHRQQADRRRRRPRAGAGAPRRDRRARLGHAAEEPLRRDRLDRPARRRLPGARRHRPRRRRPRRRRRLADRGQGAAQAVLVVSRLPPARRIDLLRAAYHLGNRHVPLEVMPIACSSSPTTCWPRCCGAWDCRSSEQRRRSSPKPARTTRRPPGMRHAMPTRRGHDHQPRRTPWHAGDHDHRHDHEHASARSRGAREAPRR